MSIKRLIIIQPENKTLIASGSPLNLSSVNDIVRGNASQPGNGDFSYRFTSPTQVSVNGEPPVSVTTDGSTYNNDIGGKGIDIVFKPDRRRNESCKVVVSDAAEGRDTSLIRLTQINNNHGTCIDLKARNSNSRIRVFLIYFNLPTVHNILKVNEAMVMFYKFAIIRPESRLELYSILPVNGDWIQGGRCAALAEAEPSWHAKRDGVSPHDDIDHWAGSAACQTLGTDVEPDVLSAPLVGSTDEWIEFRTDFDFLNDFVDRILKSPAQNHGFMIRTREDGALGSAVELRSSEYTTDITLRPKMLILYEEPGSGLDGGVFPNYPTSMGSEITFGGA